MALHLANCSTSLLTYRQRKHGRKTLTKLTMPKKESRCVPFCARQHIDPQYIIIPLLCKDVRRRGMAFTTRFFNLDATTLMYIGCAARGICAVVTAQRFYQTGRKRTTMEHCAAYAYTYSKRAWPSAAPPLHAAACRTARDPSSLHLCASNEKYLLVCAVDKLDFLTAAFCNMSKQDGRAEE